MRAACCARREAGQPICASCAESASRLLSAGIRPTSSFTKAEYMFSRACTLRRGRGVRARGLGLGLGG